MAGDKFKPQYKRLLFVDQELRGGKFPSCATMANKWEVSAKTIQRDVDYLKDEMKAPIEYDRSRHGLYYGDKTWFLPAVLLNEGDILALLIGTQALEMYKGTPVAGELKSIYLRLAQLLPEKISIAPELVFDRLSFLNAPSRPINADVWKLLIRGLLHQRITKLVYLSPRSEEPKEHLIHPLHIANIEGDWYVFGWDPRWKDITQFAVSRISKVDVTGETFVPPASFDAAKLLKDRFGKFIHARTRTSVGITLLFRADISKTIAERMWHPKQKLKWRKNGGLELRFPVPHIFDVLPWILSLGSAVRVLRPTDLRKNVREELKKALKG